MGKSITFLALSLSAVMGLTACSRPYLAGNPSKPDPVLVVIVHPDDDTMFGGILGYLKDRGADVYLICITRGEGGRENLVNGDLSQLIRLRPEEMRKAGEFYGIRELVILTEPDNPFRDPKTGVPTKDAGFFLQSGVWDKARIEEQIESMAKRVNPGTVITLLPDNPAIHAHHQAAGRIIMELQRTGRLGDHIEAVYGINETHWYPSGTFALRKDQIVFKMDRSSENLGMTYAEFQHLGAMAHASQELSRAGVLNEDEVLVPCYEKEAGKSFMRALAAVPSMSGAR